MSQQEVYNRFLRAAEAAEEKGAPINPLAAAAQACLETGFGKYVPERSNNVLGLKAGRSWKGPVVDAKTHEYTPAGDRLDDVKASWRAYPDEQSCFLDYGNIIGSLWWFEDAVAAKHDPFEYLCALKPLYSADGQTVVEPGYFTDPAYVVKAMKILREYGPRAPITFEEQYPELKGVTQLWLNDGGPIPVVKARQVGHKLYVRT